MTARENDARGRGRGSNGKSDRSTFSSTTPAFSDAGRSRVSRRKPGAKSWASTSTASSTSRRRSARACCRARPRPDHQHLLGRQRTRPGDDRPLRRHQGRAAADDAGPLRGVGEAQHSDQRDCARATSARSSIARCSTTRRFREWVRARTPAGRWGVAGLSGRRRLSRVRRRKLRQRACPGCASTAACRPASEGRRPPSPFENSLEAL